MIKYIMLQTRLQAKDMLSNITDTITWLLLITKWPTEPARLSSASVVFNA